MKEIFVISYIKNNVTQGRLIKAHSEDEARAYFQATNAAAEVYGVSPDDVGYVLRGMPCEEVPDGWVPPVEEEAPEVAEMFPRLKSALKADYQEQARKRAEFVANGSQNDPDHGIRCWSTANKWDAYQAGRISREKAIELAVKRGQRDIDKHLDRKMAKLARAEAAPRLSYAGITVEWHKSPTWGANPSVTVYTDDGTYSGRASGCGYDKESAAIGEALNQSPAVLRVLYEAAEAALAAGKTPDSQGLAPGCVTWRDILGYGSGYAILPYFEGGVGSSCFWSIFKACGYKCRHTATGKRFDSYSVEPMGREG